MLSSTRLKAAATKAGGWSDISGLCFIVITIFIFLFHNRTFRETVWKLLEAKITSLCWSAQTVAGNQNIVCQTGRVGSNNKEKYNFFLPPQTHSELLSFLFMGFIASNILWKCFQEVHGNFTTKIAFLIKFQNWDIHSWLLNIQLPKQETEGLNHQWHTGASEKLN